MLINYAFRIVSQKRFEIGILISNWWYQIYEEVESKNTKGGFFLRRATSNIWLLIFANFWVEQKTILANRMSCYWKWLQAHPRVQHGQRSE